MTKKTLNKHEKEELNKKVSKIIRSSLLIVAFILLLFMLVANNKLEAIFPAILIFIFLYPIIFNVKLEYLIRRSSAKEKKYLEKFFMNDDDDSSSSSSIGSTYSHDHWQSDAAHPASPLNPMNY